MQAFRNVPISVVEDFLKSELWEAIEAELGTTAESLLVEAGKIDIDASGEAGVENLRRFRLSQSTARGILATVDLIREFPKQLREQEKREKESE